MADQQTISTIRPARGADGNPLRRFLSATELDTRLLGMIGALVVTCRAATPPTSSPSPTRGRRRRTATKSNGVNTLLPGANTTYVITVANAGPAPADGARMSDPPVTGLSCTSASCASAGGASCPAAPLSMAQMQSAGGLLITSFPAGSTATFSVNCTVTATGF